METGLWHFGKNSPSQSDVDPDPYSPKLLEEIEKRLTWRYMEDVYPSTDGNCECDVSEFKLVDQTYYILLFFFANSLF